MTHGQPATRHSWILAGAIGLLTAILMLLIQIGSWRWDRTLQDGLITLDLINRSQQEGYQTSTLVERLLAGDHSVSVEQAMARLENLRIYSRQLSAQDTHLLDMHRTRATGPQLQAAITDYQQAVAEFASLLQQRLQAPDRVRFLDLRRQARSLELTASQLERLALADIHQARQNQHWLDAGTILLVALLAAMLLALLGHLERQRSRTFSQLAASEARLRAFTDSLPEVSFLFDRAGNYLAFYGTAHDRLYAPAEQLRNHNITDVLPQPLAQASISAIERTLASGQPQSLCYELEINGQLHHFEARLAPLMASEQVAWISWDVTQRHQAEQRVRELSQMYGLLSATSQAIVRCDTRDSLFASLCRSALEQQLFTHASIQPLPASPPDDWPDELWQRLHSGVITSRHPGNGDTLPASLQAQELASWFGLPLGLEHPPALLLQLGSTSSALDRSEIHLLLGELQDNLDHALQRFTMQQLASQQRRRLDLQAAALEGSQDAILITDLEHRILLANQAFCLRTGHARAECLGNQPLALAGVPQTTELSAELHDNLTWNGAWQGEVSGHDSNGAPLPCLLSVSRVTGRGDMPGGFIYIFTDLRRIKQAEEQVTSLTWFDPLTGLPNATRLWLELDERLYREQTEAGHTAVLFIDLNDFHSVNDAWGHACGDALLQAVGQRLLEQLGAGASVGRQGGDIFIALLPIQQAAELPERVSSLQQAFSAPFLIKDHELFVSFCAGIALSGQDGNTPNELLQRADAALHEAHQSGRGHWRSYNAQLGDQASQRLSRESLLRRALQLNLFELYYQPLLDCQTGEMHGAEALVRLRPEAGCSMGPAEFIPLLERSGLILQLGEWVQREACRQCRQWLDEGRTPGVIAINLSPVEIQEGRVHDQLQAILTQTGLPAQHIELEVTESGLLAYGSQAAAFLQRLHDLGVRLAIDDFGTGYSSLAYLKRFPVHKLKIDRTFVRDLPDDPVDSQLTSTIISLARSLDLKVLAEGVETEAQRQLLSEQGCDYWQGYLASRPLPAAEFAARFLSPAGAAST